MPSRLRPSSRLLLATAGLTTLALGTVSAAAGVGPLDVAAVRGYAQAHGLRPDVSARTAAETRVLGATPRAASCAPGSRPETGRQGRVPSADYVNGRAAKGYTCNATQVGRYGETGGFQVHRYVDRSGRECAFYDSTLLFPKDLRRGVAGATVLDMADPAKPRRTAVLVSPAMQTTHESLRLNARRGLLVAAAGSPATQVGVVDVYDVSKDCRTPVLLSSTPLGILGHEGGFSPDGRTYWVTTTALPGLTAIDLTNPALPTIRFRTTAYQSHGMSFSADGTRAYLADTGSGGGPSGLTVLDVGQVNGRTVARPTVRQVSRITWPEVSIPQNVLPVTIKGKKHLIEFDEYASGDEVGAVRIIDISREKAPKVVSRIRLEVHEKAARASDQSRDPGAQLPVQGYAAHYCSVPREVEPGIVACSMILSGLRVFDVRDPLRPREVAYFNKPKVTTDNPVERGAFAMSAPAFDPATRDVWYTDGNAGFFAVRLPAAVWPR